MPGSTQRSATAEQRTDLTPRPPLRRGEGKNSDLAVRLPLSAPERGSGGEVCPAANGEVAVRQPALLPARSAPSTSLPPRPQHRSGKLRRVTGTAWASGALLLAIVLA